MQYIMDMEDQTIFMANSTHKVECFRVEHLEKHPNADTLSIIKVFNYQAVVRTSDFRIGDLAVYITDK